MVWRPSDGNWYMFPSNWQGAYNHFDKDCYDAGDAPIP